MKSVSDYIKTIKEDGDVPATNVTSTPAISKLDVPLGAVMKRKPPLEDIQTPNPAGVENETGVTNVDSDEDKKRMFRQKQDQANSI